MTREQMIDKAVRKVMGPLEFPCKSYESISLWAQMKSIYIRGEFLRVRQEND